MRYEEILGSDDYVQRLVEAAVTLHNNGLAARDRVGRDFIVLPPGEELRTGVPSSQAFSGESRGDGRERPRGAQRQ